MWAMAGMLATATAFVASYPRLKQAFEAGSLGRLTASTGTSDRLATPLNLTVRPGEPAGQAMP